MSETLEQRPPTPPGRHVAAERVRAGLTQEEAADKLGMPRDRLSRIENGHIIPSLGEAHRFKKILGVDLMVWFGEGGDARD
jgi:transcriptional regulator with XRE-family HTH domain